MNVVYKSVLDKIAEAKDEAEKIGRYIDYIELSEAEYDALLKELKGMDMAAWHSFHWFWTPEVERRLPHYYDMNKGSLIVLGVEVRKAEPPPQ